MTATVSFLGHAGLRVTGSRTGIVLDPWFSSAGAFFGAWHQFPRNDHLDVDRLVDADWVAVSHEHLDHMDLGVLRRLPAHTRVLIPRYPSTAFRDRLLRAGVGRVVEVGAWERMPLDDAGSWLTVIPEQSPMCHDAAFLVVVDGRSVLDCNDARISAAQARRVTAELGGPVDLMTVQASGASWHPICYDYPEPVRRRIEAEKRRSKFRAVFRLVRAAQPRLAVPFAGPPCFLDPALAHHNASIPEPGVFPDQEQAARWLSEHLPQQRFAAFRPGDVLCLDSGGVVRDPVSTLVDYADLDGYLKRYAADRGDALAAVHQAHPEPGPGLDARFEEHFRRLGGLSPWFLQRIAMTIRFEVDGPNGGRWDVRLGPDGCGVDLRGRSPDVRYTFRVAGRWLLPVLTGEAAWEDLLLSLRFRAWRDPDVYNDYLVGLLKHANAGALQAVERYEATRSSGERIQVQAADGRYELPRFCPHSGEDLAEAGIVTGTQLRCLAHNFEFDLHTGECLTARCQPLDVRRI